MSENKHKTRLPWWMSTLFVLVAVCLVVSAVVLMKNHQLTVEKPAPVVEASTQPLPETSVSPNVPQGINYQAFLPETVAVHGAGHQVQRLPRVQVEGGVSSPSPLNDNPNVYAWDNQSAKPGSPRGVAIFTAHTWPPPQKALGNQLIAGLRVGDTITVKGDGVQATYRVYKRQEVTLDAYPAGKVLDMHGKPRLAITVCSGKRLGPGNWTMRTVWFAKLVSVK